MSGLNLLMFLLEAFSIILCLHIIFRERKCLHTGTLILVVFYLILFEVINTYKLNKMYGFIIYVCLVIYCRARFRVSFSKAIAGTVLCIVVMTILQFLVLLPVSMASIRDESVRGALINTIVLIVITVIGPKLGLDKLWDWIYKRDSVLYLTLLLVAVFAAAIMYQNRILEGIQAEIFCLSAPIVLLLIVWAGRWMGSQHEKEQLKKELNEQKRYQPSFDKLVTDMRVRQHHFNNQIAAILGTHYVYRTYEELVRAQNEWCQEIQFENRDNNLIKFGNSALTGFLYQKGQEIELKGIRVVYSVHIGNWNPKQPDSLVIEMLGILMDNATEAAREQADNMIWVGFEETEKYFIVSVKNQYEYVPYEKIETWFELGKSHKSGERGIGLYRVRQICKKENCSVNVKNEDQDGENRIVFEIFLSKETGQR